MRQTYSSLNGGPAYFDPEAFTAVDNGQGEVLYHGPGAYILRATNGHTGQPKYDWTELTPAQGQAWLATHAP